MCLYTHIAAGAVAGAVSGNPYLAGFMGITSHVILDYLPHHDFEKLRHELLIGALTLVLMAGLGLLGTNALIGALFGALPDLENLFWKLGMLPDEKKIFISHSGIVPHGRETGCRSIIWQTAWVGLSFLFLYKIKLG